MLKLLPAHRAQSTGALGLDPVVDAVLAITNQPSPLRLSSIWISYQMERMSALAIDCRISQSAGRATRSKTAGGRLTQGTFVARMPAIWARAVKLDAADSANVVLGNVPAPARHRIVICNLDFHGGRVGRRGGWFVDDVEGDSREDGGYRMLPAHIEAAKISLDKVVLSKLVDVRMRISRKLNPVLLCMYRTHFRHRFCFIQAKSRVPSN